MSAFNEQVLVDILPVYYKRIFPENLFYNWLCYGDPKNFDKREISFTLAGDIYLRYQSFTSLEAFAQALYKRFPIKIDIGAVYSDSVNGSFVKKTPLEREIVFDIDLTDYDEIRSCCSGADVCNNCWKFMVIACKILDAGLKEDFGFKNILWVFSGRRGIHCWVGDKQARRCSDLERSTIAEYFTLINASHRRIRLSSNIHSAVKRALNIIDEYFDEIVAQQNILGTEEKIETFLSVFEGDIKNLFREPMLTAKTSSERWNVFQTTFHRLFRDLQIPKSYKNIIEEIKLFYSYPRLDVNVTKSMNHLLKAPFCVHPKTGKVSVPFRVKNVDNFNLKEVPIITQLFDEINAYDAKNKEYEEQQKAKTENETNSESKNSNFKMKEYKKTSLFRYVAIFNEFLRGVQAAASNEKALKNGQILNF